MPRQQNLLRSDIGWSTPDKIFVKGMSLPDDLLGRVNLGDMAFLELMDRLPTAAESIVVNALLVTLVEHGITPSALATRMTVLGAPESLQGGVAAGLLGLGSVFVGSIEGTARILQEAIRLPSEDAGNEVPSKTVAAPHLTQVAEQIVAQHVVTKRTIPGLGHPIHKPVDPRTPKLFTIAEDNGFRGDYIELMEQIHEAAEAHFDRVLPINATGAIGAIATELGIPWQICRGLGVMARAVGLVGHVLEEMRQPIAQEIWYRAEEAATAHLKDEEMPCNSST